MAHSQKPLVGSRLNKYIQFGVMSPDEGVWG